MPNRKKSYISRKLPLVTRSMVLAFSSLVSCIAFLPRCFVPVVAGAFLSSDSKDALWDRFYMGAPQRRRRSVERYSIRSDQEVFAAQRRLSRRSAFARTTIFRM